jgi:hypothetical protein
VARVLREPLEASLSKGLVPRTEVCLVGPIDPPIPFAYEVLCTCPAALVEG